MLIIVFFLLLVSSERAVMGIVPAYSPVSAAWLLRHRFPMKNIGHFDVAQVPECLPIGIAGAQAKSAKEEDGASGAVILRGKARDGIVWEITISGGFCMSSFDLNVADLDKNGQQDAIFTFRVDSTGLELGFEHLILLFDKNGLPMPFVSLGWCLEESDKMLDFVDIDGDGQAEVFDQVMQGNRCLFDVYRANNTRWQQVARWPSAEDIPMGLPGRPCGNRTGKYQLATDRFVSVGRLQCLSEDVWGNTSLKVVTPAGATGSIRLRHWGDTHCVMIVDTPQSRRILFSTAPRDEWRRTMAELALKPHRLFIAGDLGSSLRKEEPTQRSPMAAWFFAEFPEDGKR